MSETSAPSPYSRVAASILKILNEASLGFLALTSLFLGLAPLAFDIGPRSGAFLTAADLVIVFCFLAEYSAGLLLADDRARFLRDPWRLLDAFIIVTAMIALFPFAHAALSNTPALRLIRLSRVALLGSRAGAAISSGEPPVPGKALEPEHPLTAQALVDVDAPRFSPCDWDAVLRQIGSDEDDWIFLSGVRREHLNAVAETLGLPPAILRGKLFDATYPRFDRLERMAVLSLWYPRLVETHDDWRVERAAVLVVGSAQNVVVMSREPTDLPRVAEQRLPELGVGAPPLVGATFGLFGAILDAYGRVVEQLERTLMMLEGAESRLRDRSFLERTFRLRAEISRVRGNLRYLRTVVRDFADQPVGIKGFESVGEAGGTVNTRAQFAFLADQADDLYDRVDDMRETLAALVDLRLNVASFQMNKVMRLLAILTTLALIPSVAGGVLGMNLADTPWPPTLAEVSFGVAAGMAFSLYLFAIKGWLR